MANKFQLKRTTVSGRTANTTDSGNTSFIDKGELAVNLADRKVFSSDSANALFEVGSNLSSLSVGSIVANGSLGTSGQVLTTNSSGVYWATAGGGVNADQVTYTYTIAANTTVISGADDATQTLSYTAGLESVFINGSRQISGVDYNTTNSAAITLTSNVIAGEVVQVITWQGAVNSANVDAQYTWTNTHTFNSLLTAANSIYLTGGGDVIISSAGVGGANANTSFYNDASDLYVNVNNAIRAYIASNGNFGVGNTSPAHRFRVDGNVSYSGTLFTAGISANGSVGSSGQILTSNGSQAYWQTQQFRTAGQTVVSANTTLDSTYLGENILVVTADITITLPSSGFDSGTLAFISNVSGGKVNLSYAYAGDGPTVLYPNDSVILCTDGNGASLYWRQYSYTNTLQLEPIVAVSALDVDCSKGTYFTKTIAANSTFTFSNVPTSVAYSFTLEVTHTSGTITWPAAVKWPSDTAPTLTTGKTHLFMFTTANGGTRWRGSALVDYVN